MTAAVRDKLLIHVQSASLLRCVSTKIKVTHQAAQIRCKKLFVSATKGMARLQYIILVEKNIKFKILISLF